MEQMHIRTYTWHRTYKRMKAELNVNWKKSVENYPIGLELNPGPTVNRLASDVESIELDSHTACFFQCYANYRFEAWLFFISYICSLDLGLKKKCCTMLIWQGMSHHWQGDAHVLFFIKSSNCFWILRSWVRMSEKTFHPSFLKTAQGIRKIPPPPPVYL
jgi:hypothetical protein